MPNNEMIEILKDIRSELQTANKRLESVETEQKGTNQHLERVEAEQKGMREEQKAMKEAITVTNQRLDMTRQELWNLRKDVQVLKTTYEEGFDKMAERLTHGIVGALDVREFEKYTALEKRVAKLELASKRKK